MNLHPHAPLGEDLVMQFRSRTTIEAREFMHKNTGDRKRHDESMKLVSKIQLIRLMDES
jgi:hypothetical protein